jgi:hypothetical protein
MWGFFAALRMTIHFSITRVKVLKLEEAEGGERRQEAGFGGVAAKERDGLDAGGREGVVDVMGEVVADGGGGNGDAGRPFFNKAFDVSEAVVAGELKVCGELGGGEGQGVIRCGGEGFGADGPDGGDPGEVGAGGPFVSEVEP